MNDIECPYCESMNEVCHDDGQNYEEDKAHEMQCSDCQKNFVFHTAISFYYTAEKADCLNGEAHRFTPWRKLWEREGKTIEQRACVDCNHREQQERKKTAPTA